MGGKGSGNHSWRRLPRNLVEWAVVLDVSALRALREADPVASGEITLVARATGRTLVLGYIANFTDPANPHLELVFHVNGEMHHQVISLAMTQPNYGGTRYWFLCPVSGERTRCIYLPQGATAFASRKVHELVYRSQGESAYWREVRDEQKIRVQLGGDPSIYSPFPLRPKGMHQSTYQRLRQRVFSRKP